MVTSIHSSLGSALAHGRLPTCGLGQLAIPRLCPHSLDLIHIHPDNAPATRRPPASTPWGSLRSSGLGRRRPPIPGRDYPAQVRAALPPTGSRRKWAEYGLRSLFKVLKVRKLIFANTTRGMPIRAVDATVALPLDTAAVRQALDSADPAIALAVALVAFHALMAQLLAGLQLTDIVDGRLHLAGRDIPLAGPVRVRLGAWLDHRNRTWPASINAHLFVGRVSAPRLVPVGKQSP